MCEVHTRLYSAGRTAWHVGGTMRNLVIIIHHSTTLHRLPPQPPLLLNNTTSAPNFFILMTVRPPSSLSPQRDPTTVARESSSDNERQCANGRKPLQRQHTIWLSKGEVNTARLIFFNNLLQCTGDVDPLREWPWAMHRAEPRHTYLRIPGRRSPPPPQQRQG